MRINGFFLRDLFRQMVVLGLAVIQFVVPFFSQITGIGRSIESQAGKDMATSPEVPADYAFSIWFVIFILSVIYAVYQALPSQRENRIFKEIGGWTAGLFFLSSLWMLIVQVYGDGWLLAGIIILMLLSALKVFFSLIQNVNPLDNFDRFIMAPLFGLFSGWLSVAAFLNTASVIKASSLHTCGLSINAFAMVTILSAMILSIVNILRSKGQIWYGGTILWALAGVMAANIIRAYNPLIVGVAGMGFLFVLGIVLYARRASV